MSKTIVISDLHNRVDWVEPFLATQTYDKCIFLGDYFDDFGDSPLEAAKTAIWLKKSLTYSNRIHLWGNHDIWYAYPKAYWVLCSGNNNKKLARINEILNREDWYKLRLYDHEQNFILSHAGICKEYFSHPFKGVTTEFIYEKCAEAMDYIKAGTPHPLFNIGWSRGGNAKIGGVLWQDFDVEFKPITGINQIVGHTPHPRVEEKLCPNRKYANSLNYDIDTTNTVIGILENGKFNWVKNSFIKKKDKPPMKCRSCGRSDAMINGSCHHTHVLD